jgi:hypothetical protein
MEGHFHHGEFGHGGWEHEAHHGMENSHNDGDRYNQ